MRTETIVRTLYTAAELRDAHPEGFDRALESHVETVCADPWHWDEICQSLDAIAAFVANIHPDDYAACAGDVRRRGEACEFTGVWSDCDIARAASDAMAAGESSDVVLAQMDDAAQRIYEDEIDAQCTPEAFIEDADADGWEFTESGEIV